MIGQPARTHTPPILTTSSIISYCVATGRRISAITFHSVFAQLLQHTIDTRHSEFDHLIPPLCRGSLEDHMYTASMLHDVNMQALMTRTSRLSRPLHLGGHLLHLTLRILDIGITLTK